MGIGFDSKVQMAALNVLLIGRGLEARGRVQRYVDSEVLKLTDKYVPFRDGKLKESGTRNTKIGSGEVVYRTPYARRMYYNPQFNFSGAPLRGAYFFERSKIDNKKTILNGAIDIAGARR
ncbi:minor capsid protein [Senegalia massiliensis]|nr:minor capsid protein [Senegalia massiliensis]